MLLANDLDLARTYPQAGVPIVFENEVVYSLWSHLGPVLRAQNCARRILHVEKASAKSTSAVKLQMHMVVTLKVAPTEEPITECGASNIPCFEFGAAYRGR